MFHLVLSLLLLFSQHLAQTHALSHLSPGAPVATPASASQASAAGSLATQLDDESSRSQSAHDAGCHLCLSIAQLAAPLTQQGPTFLLAQGRALQAALHGAAPAAAPSFALFQSRAPPLAKA